MTTDRTDTQNAPDVIPAVAAAGVEGENPTLSKKEKLDVNGTANTPDMTSTLWLGDLAEELGPELTEEFTAERRAWYEHGAQHLDLPAGDLDGSTAIVLRKVNQEVGEIRLARRTADYPVPSWSVKTEKFTTYSDEHDRGHRHHSIGVEHTVVGTGLGWFPDDEGEAVDVHGCARETEDGEVTFSVELGSGNDLRSFTTAEARKLALAIYDAADQVDAIARRHVAGER